MHKKNFLQIDPIDNLIVALTDLASGTVVDIAGKTVELQQDIPAKHKFALCDLTPEDFAVMYGVIVGTPNRVIVQGALISTENLDHATTPYKETHEPFAWHQLDFTI